ncbi:MAG: helix-turn-helix domain-containing protein [Roseovarius sp.]|nr:helix-turn-helix domain-containing protein [Roseovarius sp.]
MRQETARKASYKPVEAAMRVLDVLLAVNTLRDEASVGAIHRKLGLSKPTVVRMLETLIAAGYVVRDDARHVYRVTGKTISLASSFDGAREVARLAAPLMSRFRNSIGWPSDLAIFDADAMLVIGSSRELGPLSFNRAPGYRGPVLTTSLGLSYCAFCRGEMVDALFERMRGKGALWRGPEEDRERLAARLENVRRCGFAEMDPEYSRIAYGNRVSGLAVPVLGSRKVYAAINLIYFKTALDRDSALLELVPRLQGIAAQLGALFEEHALDLGDWRCDVPQTPEMMTPELSEMNAFAGHEGMP